MNNIGQALRYSTVYKYLKTIRPKNILEIGSGSQGIGSCYNIKFDGLDLTTNDYGNKEKQTNKNMKFIKGSCLQIPISDNSYEFVFSTDMIEHINKKDRMIAFEEAYRVCKNGGYILFLFPCGFFGKFSDYIIKYILKIYGLLINKKNIIPMRLKEHLDKDYPTHNEINIYIRKYNIIENKRINNIFYQTYTSLIDLSKQREKQKIKAYNKILSNYKNNDRRSLFGVRKLILIKK